MSVFWTAFAWIVMVPLRPGWLRCADCGLTWKEKA